MSLTLNTESIQLITLFENLTGTAVKDCVIDIPNNTVYFVIQEGKIAIAIGKNGASVKNAERIIKKTIKIFEFSGDLNSFIKKLIPQASEIKIKTGDKTSVEVRVDKKDKAIVIGREGRNLKIFRELLERNHGVHELTIR
jgi:transcription termination/antitermination protein NusA